MMRNLQTIPTLVVAVLIACFLSVTEVRAEPQQLSNEQLALALHMLQSQKLTLEAADHDYGGHRADAVRDINRAERQLRDALGYSNNGKGGTNHPHIPEPQVMSDRQLRQSMPVVNNAIASLNGADHDYGGHRANAVRDLQAAESQLHKALNYRGLSANGGVGRTTGSLTSGGTSTSSGSSTGTRTPTNTGTPTSNKSGGTGHPEPQRLSNEQLAQALHVLQSQKKTLEAADHDYGGHRADAVRDINRAERQLRDALGYSNNGKGGANHPHIPEPQVMSDNQLRQSMPVVNNAIASLEGANHDYGGHRANAVRDLQAASGQLNKALNYRGQLTNSGNGNSTGTSTSTSSPNGPNSASSASKSFAPNNSANTAKTAQTPAEKLKALSPAAPHQSRPQIARQSGSMGSRVSVPPPNNFARFATHGKRHSAKHAVQSAAKKHSKAKSGGGGHRKKK